MAARSRDPPGCAGRDVHAFGQWTRLRVRKRVWRCHEPVSGRQTRNEQHPDRAQGGADRACLPASPRTAGTAVASDLVGLVPRCAPSTTTAGRWLTIHTTPSPRSRGLLGHVDLLWVMSNPDRHGVLLQRVGTPVAHCGSDRLKCVFRSGQTRPDVLPGSETGLLTAVGLGLVRQGRASCVRQLKQLPV